MTKNPTTLYKQPPFEVQQQGFPGKTRPMVPKPDHGEESYKGSKRLQGKAALITGGDSGIGRAVAIAYAREGADVAIAYLESEEVDAREVEALITEAGVRALLIPTDISKAAEARSTIARVVEKFAKLDILVNNAAFQVPTPSLEDTSDEDWERMFATNVHGTFYVTKAAVGVMSPGGSIINTASVNTKHPTAGLFGYSATKGALGNMTVAFAQLLADRGIRVNAVLPGPIWTPFIVAGMEPDAIKSFGSKTPYGRPGQPVEVAPPYVMLASDEASYMSGALVTVAGGMPIF
ncbi:SDR family oxidoreductase [Acidisoma cellulosilytica]|uniref:SDR family oxidoreductase n=1 Tax=Acidisoma cellulosilyticum TaxID=2802395 RepID=A0A963Z7E9_9PROT|nr:SDR family oxidoreductase [Acidisoma cellulosilyticum]MCB8883884.1 SDR family oxidoreductase [Acidisoma cellulosilyticum]